MIKTIIRSSVTTIVLFVAAAALIIAGSVGAAQAAPRIVSNDYRAEVQLSNIHVALTENGTVVEGNDTLLKNLLPANEKEIQIGKKYENYNLAARNVGVADNNGIPQYVRVTVTKYWVDEATGAKDTSLDPSLIDLHFIETEGWTIDHDVSDDSTETTVLYYNDIVQPGANTGNFTDSLTIDGKVLTEKKTDKDGNSVYAYKGKKFEIKAVVDAVQTHNGTQAMTSAWGRTN